MLLGRLDLQSHRSQNLIDHCWIYAKYQPSLWRQCGAQPQLLAAHDPSAFSNTSTPAPPACAASPNDRRHRFPLGTPFINPAREHEAVTNSVSGVPVKLTCPQLETASAPCICRVSLCRGSPCINKFSAYGSNDRTASSRVRHGFRGSP
jgi:hypothetical protein